VLNEREKEKMEELMDSQKVYNTPLPEFTGNYAIKNFVDIVKLSDLAIRRLIKMAKKIPPFRTLCEEDKIALLKGASTELMFLRSVLTFNAEKDVLNVPTVRIDN